MPGYRLLEPFPSLLQVIFNDFVGKAKNALFYVLCKRFFSLDNWKLLVGGGVAQVGRIAKYETTFDIIDIHWQNQTCHFVEEVPLGKILCFLVILNINLVFKFHVS